MIPDTIPGHAKKVQEHADALYKLLQESNPGADGVRPVTETDKRMSAAMWHGHEVCKYLSAIVYANEKQRKEAQRELD